MVKNLQSLRGIAALMIFAHHFGFQSTVTESFGDCAVAIFMMLSGFVLTLSFCSRDVQTNLTPTFSQFFTKRIIRIYPLYFLGQLCMFSLCKFNIGLLNAIADLLMMQSWIPLSSYYFSGNAPSWFVSDLMLCYLLFLPTVKLFTTNQRLSISIIILAFAAYSLCSILLPEKLVLPIIYIFPPMQFPVFAIGMLGGILISKTTTGKSNLNADILLLVPILLLILQIYVYPLVSIRLRISLYWWPTSFLLIYMWVKYDKTKCIITSVLHTKALIKLGDISYVFYIFHMPFLYIWNILMHRLNITLHSGVAFVISATVLACICYIIHLIIEKPVTRYLDKRLLKESR